MQPAEPSIHIWMGSDWQIYTNTYSFGLKARSKKNRFVITKNLEHRKNEINGWWIQTEQKQQTHACSECPISRSDSRQNVHIPVWDTFRLGAPQLIYTISLMHTLFERPFIILSLSFVFVSGTLRRTSALSIEQYIHTHTWHVDAFAWFLYF